MSFVITDCLVLDFYLSHFLTYFYFLKKIIILIYEKKNKMLEESSF